MSYTLELLRMENEFWPNHAHCHTRQNTPFNQQTGEGLLSVIANQTTNPNAPILNEAPNGRMCGRQAVNSTGPPTLTMGPKASGPIPLDQRPHSQSREINDAVDPGDEGDDDQHHHSCAKVIAAAAHRGTLRPMHSYYECCINVHVSSLLEHWLDWDRAPLISTVPKGGIRGKEGAHADTDLDGSQAGEFASQPKLHLNPTSIEGWVRQISSNGCDVNRQDSEGRTLLHLLLNGASHNFTGETVVELTRLLVETGANPSVRDHRGETPLHLVKHWLHSDKSQSPSSSPPHQTTIMIALTLGRLLLESGTRALSTDQCLSAWINLPDSDERTLLSYSVAMGDSAEGLTRLLLNYGAEVIPSPSPLSSSSLSSSSGGPVATPPGSLDSSGPPPHPVQQLTKERTQSAFTWLLKSVMEKRALEPFQHTINLVGQSMAHQPLRMKRHIKRVMMHLGRGISVNGPLFLELKTLMMPFWCNPLPLRHQCLRQIRKSLGPKRLNRGPVSQLGLPTKLQRLVRFQSEHSEHFEHFEHSVGSVGSECPSRTDDE